MDQFIASNGDLIDYYCKMIADGKQAKKVSDSEKPEDGELLVSDKIRQKANICYKKKQFHQALGLYTESVMTAKSASSSESLAYGNRSAVSYEVGNFQLALRDIDNALANCPAVSKKKLLLRKASCHSKLENKTKLHEVCECIKKLDKNREIELSSEEMRKLEELQSELSSSKLNSTQAVDPKLCLYKKDEGLVPFASQVITIEKNPAKGRHLKITDNVPGGSVLILERPYVSVLLPDYWTTHCYHCHKSNDGIPVFCRERSCGVSYCNNSCESEAWSSYHRFECSLLHIIVNTGIGHLAFRTVIQTGYNDLLEYREYLANKCHSLPECLKRYHDVYNLVTNEDKILQADQFYYMKTSLLLLLCALDCNFIPESLHVESPKFTYIGSLLLHHIQQLICNAHAITLVGEGAGDDNSPVTSHAQVKLATAIYPTASLMNHSCKPNISVSFNGTLLVVKNTADLVAGDEIFNCYGPHYLKMDKKTRQESLKSQYYFTCECEACLSETISVSKAFRCIQCDGPALLLTETSAQCTVCTHSYDAGHQIQSLLQAKQLMKDIQQTATPDLGIELMKRCISMLKETVYETSIDLAEALDLEAKLFASKGDMRLCSESLKKSIGILQTIYGAESIELAHEYHKISEVLCNTKDYKAALDYAIKAKGLFTQLFSQNHAVVLEIECLCHQIKNTMLQ